MQLKNFLILKFSLSNHPKLNQNYRIGIQFLLHHTSIRSITITSLSPRRQIAQGSTNIPRNTCQSNKHKTNNSGCASPPILPNCIHKQVQDILITIFPIDFTITRDPRLLFTSWNSHSLQKSASTTNAPRLLRSAQKYTP